MVNHFLSAMRVFRDSMMHEPEQQVDQPAAVSTDNQPTGYHEQDGQVSERDPGSETTREVERLPATGVGTTKSIRVRSTDGVYRHLCKIQYRCHVYVNSNIGIISVFSVASPPLAPTDLYCTKSIYTGSAVNAGGRRCKR